MSVQPRPAAMPGDHRGGCPVARLSALPSRDALAVLMLRDWCSDDDGRAQGAASLCAVLGPAQTQNALAAWEAVAALLQDHCRRPVLLCDRTCGCVGADEAVLAQTLTLAAIGAREDAMWILSLLVPADRLLWAVAVFEQAGRVLLRLEARQRVAPPPVNAGVLH